MITSFLVDIWFNDKLVSNNFLEIKFWMYFVLFVIVITINALLFRLIESNLLIKFLLITQKKI